MRCNSLHFIWLVRVYIIYICYTIGGKGGFGSLLKNQAQTRRKVTNWDQSREVDGKRIGHSNNESGLVEFYRKRKEERQSKPNVEEEDVVHVLSEGEARLS